MPPLFPAGSYVLFPGAELHRSGHSFQTCGKPTRKNYKEWNVMRTTPSIPRRAAACAEPQSPGAPLGFFGGRNSQRRLKGLHLPAGQRRCGQEDLNTAITSTGSVQP
jgi:hypothetical protein